MTRRCTSEVCLAKAARATATLDLPTVNLLANPRSDWQRLTMGKVRVARSLASEVDWKTYTPERYIFSHVSIVASCVAGPNGHYVMAPTDELINTNGNGWFNELLLATFRTFIGGENFLEHCFSAGTRVLMSDGTYREIQEIRAGDRVINRKGEVGSVTRVGSRVSSSIMKISSVGILSRDLFVTAEHPFWVFHARETCPKTGRPNGFDLNRDMGQLPEWPGLARGVHCASGESFPCGMEPCWKNAGDIDRSRDLLTRPISLMEIPEAEVNENRAELIGWFLAEGSFAKTNHSSEDDSGVIFNLGNDEGDVAERITRLLICEFSRAFVRKDCKPRIRESESGSLTVGLSNKEVAEFFRFWCGKYAWGKKLNEKALWLPKRLQAKILKSCINGDGCGAIEFRGYMLEMKSRDLIQQLLFIAWRLGLNPTYYEAGVLPRYTERNVVDGYEVFTDPLTGKKSRPGYLLRFSVQDSAVLNEASGETDNRIASRLGGTRTYKLTSTDGQWLAVKIGSAERMTAEVTVYNLKVEGDNSYIAEGVVVHNCQIPAQSKGKLLDAVARPVRYKGEHGQEADIYFIDLLVATERKHTRLIAQIEGGEMNCLSMGCFVAGTRIMAADGVSVPIEIVKAGDRVRTHTGGVARVGSVRARPCADGELRRLTFHGAPEVIVTKEHPYWTLQGYDVCRGCGKALGREDRAPIGQHGVSELTEREAWCSKSCYQKKRNSMRKVHADPLVEQSIVFGWTPAGELRKKDFVAIPLGRPPASRKSLPPAKCRLLGLYAAEGNLQRDGKKAVRAIELTFGVGDKAIETMTESVEALGVPKERLYVKERHVRLGSSVRAVIHDRELARECLELVGEHCDHKRFAPSILELDDESRLNILGAYFDGDGHCRKSDGRYSACSCSRALAEQVWTMLLSVGIPATISGPHCVGVPHRRPIWTVGVLSGIAAQRLARRTFRYNSRPLAGVITSQFMGHMLIRVNGNEAVPGSHAVYNMHVESDDHSYIANGVAVHNCIAAVTVCSQCGKEFHDEQENCEHLATRLLRYFKGSDGQRHIVAEMCGRLIKGKDGKWVGDPDSQRFIEASWVRNPAFRGAVLNHFILDDSTPERAARKAQMMGTQQLALSVEDMFRVRVADEIGMITLKVAWEELRRRRNEALVDTVARKALVNLVSP